MEELKDLKKLLLRQGPVNSEPTEQMFENLDFTVLLYIALYCFILLYIA